MENLVLSRECPKHDDERFDIRLLYVDLAKSFQSAAYLLIPGGINSCL